MKRWLLLLLMLVSFQAVAQQELAIIQLKNRTIDQILPILSPLVEPGGTLTGMNDQIILRTSPGNLAQIREVLATLDTLPRNLLVTVSNDISRDSEGQGAALTGRIELGTSSNVRIQGRAYDTASSGNQNTSQRVQVMDGGSAYLMVGRSLPIPFRQVVMGANGRILSESLVYRDIGSGLTVTPRVAGNNVSLEISPNYDRAGRSGIEIQRLSTIVSGKLGEWMELGGSNQDESGRESGYAGYASSRGRDNRSVWLRVDEVK